MLEHSRSQNDVALIHTAGQVREPLYRDLWIGGDFLDVRIHERDLDVAGSPLGQQPATYSYSELAVTSPEIENSDALGRQPCAEMSYQMPGKAVGTLEDDSLRLPGIEGPVKAIQEIPGRKVGGGTGATVGALQRMNLRRLLQQQHRTPLTPIQADRTGFPAIEQVRCLHLCARQSCQSHAIFVSCPASRFPRWTSLWLSLQPQMCSGAAGPTCRRRSRMVTAWTNGG